LGPGAAAAWLSSPLLPLWVSDLIFGLKMGLWQVKSGEEQGGKGKVVVVGGGVTAAVAVASGAVAKK
jgi:hypothetical protein